MGFWDAIEKAKEAEKVFAGIDMEKLGPMMAELPAKLEQWSVFLVSLQASQARMEAQLAEVLNHVRPAGDIPVELTAHMAEIASDDPRNQEV